MMAEEELTYENAVKIIEEIEGANQKDADASIEISNIINSKPLVVSYDYKEASRIADLLPPVQHEGYAEAYARKAAGPGDEGVSKKGGAFMRRDMEKAQGELHGIFGGLMKKNRKEHVEEAVPAEDNSNIMIGLSYQDQISELEQIMSGLDENVFEGEHKAIIKEEVLGLKKYAKKERRPVDKAEAELIAIRNKRLDEAISKLKAKKVI